MYITVSGYNLLNELEAPFDKNKLETMLMYPWLHQKFLGEKYRQERHVGGCSMVLCGNK